MKREIKFRAWSDNAKTMLKDITPVDLFEGGMREQDDCSRYINETASGLQWDIREMVLMQYTGLQDKNGVEIYEGDIVAYRQLRYKTVRCIVEYHSNYFALRKVDRDQHSFVTYAPMSCKVIGNIYENPELLNNQRKEIG